MLQAFDGCYVLEAEDLALSVIEDELCSRQDDSLIFEVLFLFEQVTALQFDVDLFL